MKQFNLHELSLNQRKAVIWNEGPLLLLAGPGSGKTHTITNRLIHLINLGVPPEKILIITFTKEAALSMQRRFYASYHKQVSVQFATFHSFFYQILKSVKQFSACTIITPGRKRVLLHQILDQKTDLSFAHQEDLSDALEKIISAISYYKNTQDYNKTLNQLEGTIRQHFELIFRVYQYEMQQRNYIDFDDMLYECLQLLQKNKSLRSEWQKRFRYILIDEFQDINPMQYEIIKLLATKPFNLFAVGDDDQSIYGFRGSMPELMKRFVEDYSAAIYHLDLNYRSGKEIVHASDLVIRENQNRFEKSLNSGRDELQSRVQIQSFENRKEQNRTIIDKIKEFSKRYEAEGKQAAILFRTNSYMQGMAARLSAEGIPFSMKESCKSIYEHPIVKDICAYLQLAHGAWSISDMIRIMNKPVRFLSRDAIAESNSLEDVMAFYTLNAKYGKGYQAERSAIEKLIKQMEVLKSMSLVTGIQYILKVIGYERYVSTQEYYRDAYEEVLLWMKEDASCYTSFADWLEAQKRYNLQLEARKPDPRNQKQETIHLMTVHGAKGLEFHTVFMPDCNEKIYPNLRLPEQDALEEERRIFYVGMTRAIENLYLYAVSGTKEHPKAVSRFLKPLL